MLAGKRYCVMIYAFRLAVCASALALLPLPSLAADVTVTLKNSTHRCVRFEVTPVAESAPPAQRGLPGADAGSALTLTPIGDTHVLTVAPTHEAAVSSSLFTHLISIRAHHGNSADCAAGLNGSAIHWSGTTSGQPLHLTVNESSSGYWFTKP